MCKRLKCGTHIPQVRGFSRESLGALDLCPLKFGGHRKWYLTLKSLKVKGCGYISQIAEQQKAEKDEGERDAVLGGSCTHSRCGGWGERELDKVGFCRGKLTVLKGPCPF